MAFSESVSMLIGFGHTIFLKFLLFILCLTGQAVFYTICAFVVIAVTCIYEFQWNIWHIGYIVFLLDSIASQQHSVVSCKKNQFIWNSCTCQHKHSALAIWRLMKNLCLFWRLMNIMLEFLCGRFGCVCIVGTW